MESIHSLHTPSKPPSIKIPVSLLPFILTALLTGASTWALFNWRMNTAEKALEKHDIEITSTKENVVEIKNDVKWIKEYLMRKGR